MKSPQENEIHPTAIISGDVRLGNSNRILAYCVLEGPLEIGDNNVVGPHVTIGTPGENSREPHYDTSKKVITIGSNNIIREFSTVQKPCFTDLTRINSGAFLMHGVHIPHDATLEDKVVFAPLVVIGGSTTILEGANLGISSTTHQNTVVGQYSMVAMGAVVTKNVKPFSKHIPGKPPSVNEYAITKYGFEACADEIRDYVLRNVAPRSERIGNLISHYERLHVASCRPQY
jgi:UDP-N-acetylglucosamine acyltransferase